MAQELLLYVTSRSTVRRWRYCPSQCGSKVHHHVVKNHSSPFTHTMSPSAHDTMLCWRQPGQAARLWCGIPSSWHTTPAISHHTSCTTSTFATQCSVGLTYTDGVATS